MHEKLTIEPWVVSPSGIAHESLDEDAVRTVERLSDRNYEAYFVGGCVRDILVGRQPKDFDIATAARPQQVKRTFPRNCRIIGRRFKLAHLHFEGGRKILEVSTFRRTPEENGNGSGGGGGEGDDAEEADLLITHDNEFGNAEEDALRRDFTVNALFFDPLRDRIIDYVGGMRDLEERVIRTIGDPVVRFREDPVRILRAAKFAGRLGFHVAPSTLDAMTQVAPDLRRSAPPRVLEEILRLLRGGHALDSFQLLRDVGAIQVILPLVGSYLERAPADERIVFWRLLEALDGRVHAGNVPSSPVLLGTLFTRPVAIEAARRPHDSPTIVAEQLLGDLTQSLRLPRRDAGFLKRICSVQSRFAGRQGKRFRPDAFARDPFFPAALELFELNCQATGDDHDQLAHWRERGGASSPAASDHDRDEGEDFAAEATPAELDGGHTPSPEATAPTEPRAGDDQQFAEADDDVGGDEAGLETAQGGARRKRRRRRGRRGRNRDRHEDLAATNAPAVTAGDDAREPAATDDVAADEPGAEASQEQPRPTEARTDATDTSSRSRRRHRRDRTPPTRHGEARPNEQRPSEQRPPEQRHNQQRQEQQHHDQSGASGREGRRKRRKDRRDRGERREEQHREERRGTPPTEVAPRNEAPDFDRSILDQAIDPKEVPTFGALVEGGKGPKRRRPPRITVEEELGDPYRPPPHRNDGDGPPPPPPPAPPGHDVFGDW